MLALQILHSTFRRMSSLRVASTCELFAQFLNLTRRSGPFPFLESLTFERLVLPLETRRSGDLFLRSQKRVARRVV